jgi:signal transduction histidine kinase
MRVLIEKGLLLTLSMTLVMTPAMTLTWAPSTVLSAAPSSASSNGNEATLITGLLLAISMSCLAEWMNSHAIVAWSICAGYAIASTAIPSWCAFIPVFAYDLARLTARGHIGANRRPAGITTTGAAAGIAGTGIAMSAEATRGTPEHGIAAHTVAGDEGGNVGGRQHSVVAANVVRWLWVLPLAVQCTIHSTGLAHIAPVMVCALLGFALGVSRARSESALRALRHAQDRAREHARSARMRIADIDEERAQSIRMATLGERTRIAREIHDNVGHLLTRAIMQAQAGKTVADATADSVAAQGFEAVGLTLDDAMTMVRRSVHDLEDDGTDFAAQIDDAVRSFDGACPGFTVSLTNDIGKAPAPVARCFATVIREALSNVVHHSDAQRAIVTLRDFPAFWQLVVQDSGPAKHEVGASGGALHMSQRLVNGTTSGVSSIGETLRGMGLADIETRVRAIGGTALSGPYDSGWRVFTSVPKQRWASITQQHANTNTNTNTNTAENRGKQ